MQPLGCSQGLYYYRSKFLFSCEDFPENSFVSLISCHARKIGLLRREKLTVPQLFV
jgi:hypothetical protein